MAIYPGQIEVTDKFKTMRDSVNSLITDVTAAGGVGAATTLGGKSLWSDGDHYDTVTYTDASGITHLGTTLQFSNDDATLYGAGAPYQISLSSSGSNPDLQFIDDGETVAFTMKDNGLFEIYAGINGTGISWAGTNASITNIGGAINMNTTGNSSEFSVSGLFVDGAITVSGTVDGRDIAADGNKLDLIDDNSDNYGFFTASGNTGASAGIDSADAYIINGVGPITTNMVDNANIKTLTITHLTTSGNNHIPSGGGVGDILQWTADGSAVWAAPAAIADAGTVNGFDTASSGDNFNVIPIVDGGGVFSGLTYLDFYSSDVSVTRSARFSNASTSFQFEDASANIRFAVANSGNIGIPTGDRLYLDGTSNTGNSYLQEDAADNIRIVTNNAERFNANSSGVQVISDITATGDIVAFASDIRLKDITEVLDDSQSYDDIQTWSTFKYTFNDIAVSNNVSNKETVHIGVSAQDIQTTDPELTKLAPFDANDDGESISGENYLTVQYEKLTVKLISALKHQALLTADLQDRLDILENK